MMESNILLGMSLGWFYKVTLILDLGKSIVNYSQGRHTEGMYSMSKTLFKWALEYLHNGEEFRNTVVYV